MSERSMRVGLGIFVAVAFVLLGTMVLLFRSLPRFLSGGTTYTVLFPDAPGLSAGTPVRRSGVRIGEASSVSLDDETGKVRANILIDRGYTLRKNEQPTLVTGFLGSDATIDFIPKPVVEGQPQDRSAVSADTPLEGVRQVTVNTLLNRASAVVPATQETMNDIRKSLQRLEKMSPLMEETMKEYRDLAKEARNALPDLRKTNDDVRDLVKSVREAVPVVNNTADEVSALSRTYNRLGER
ncbi:MAG: MlaD family protein, partial [Candidatus Acidiferrum sp.]